MRAMDAGSHRALLVRVAITVPVVALLFRIAWDSGIALVAASIAVPTMVGAAIFLGVPLAGLIGDRAVCLLGSDEAARPRPILSRGEALVVAERYDEAIEAYLGQTVGFPRETELWGRLFELAAVHLGDFERARALHDHAKSAFDRVESRSKLDARYLQQIERNPRGVEELAFERTRLEQEREALRPARRRGGPGTSGHGCARPRSRATTDRP